MLAQTECPTRCQNTNDSLLINIVVTAWKPTVNYLVIMFGYVEIFPAKPRRSIQNKLFGVELLPLTENPTTGCYPEPLQISTLTHY